MRPALVLALVCSLGASAADEHPALREGVWVQLAPVEVSWSFDTVDPLSFLPWLPVTFGADVGRLQFGVGVGVRSLVRDVVVLASPVLRWQLPTPAQRVGGVVEVRLHAGVLPHSGLSFGGGFGLGFDVFVLDWLAVSPVLGLDVLAGATGGSRSGIGLIGSARVALNASF